MIYSDYAQIRESAFKISERQEEYLSFQIMERKIYAWRQRRRDF